MSPVAALALVPADASADAAGGASLPGAVVVEGLPPQAAATSTAALAPMSNRRRMPPERFVMVCSSVWRARSAPMDGRSRRRSLVGGHWRHKTRVAAIDRGPFPSAGRWDGNAGVGVRPRRDWIEPARRRPGNEEERRNGRSWVPYPP